MDILMKNQIVFYKNSLEEIFLMTYPSQVAFLEGFHCTLKYII